MKQLTPFEALRASKKETDPNMGWSPWFRVKPEHLVTSKTSRGLHRHMRLIPEVQEWVDERNGNNDAETIISYGLMIRFKDDGILAEYMLRWGVEKVYNT